MKRASVTRIQSVVIQQSFALHQTLAKIVNVLRI
jgi:hypothetical protein